MFGFRKRRAAAAAEAAREAERRALFVQLAQRPANICPFLGLAHQRTGYVDGPSMEHRCFAFGDPAPLSSEQQTRVCQERGYGQCPRYLRGLLVTPPEELQALRNPTLAAIPAPAPTPAAAAEPPGRRRGALLAIGLVLLLLAGAAAAYLLLFRGSGVATDPSGGPTQTADATSSPTAGASTTGAPSSAPASATAAPSGIASPTPEPTPAAGDTFAFYEVAVAPGSYLLFALDAGGRVTDQRSASFSGFSFARVEPVEGAEDDVYWQTAEGGLEGLSYRSPDSGDFRIRAVFLDAAGSRRSLFLEPDELTRLPEATPAP